MEFECWSLDFWFRVFVCIILVTALWKIMQLFLPYLESKLPVWAVQILNIIIWAGMAILALVVIFFFLACIWGLVSGTFGGGMHLPSGNHRSELPFHLAGLPLLGWRFELPRPRQWTRTIDHEA